MITSSNKIQRPKVMVMVAKALMPPDTNYSPMLKCSMKLLCVAVEFSFFFSSHFIRWWIWNAPGTSDRSCVPSTLPCAWSTAGSLSHVADSVKEHTASAPSSWRCLGSLGPRIWSAPGEQICLFFRIPRQVILWSETGILKVFHYKCPYFPFIHLFPGVETVRISIIGPREKLDISVGSHCKLHMHILKWMDPSIFLFSSSLFSTLFETEYTWKWKQHLYALFIFISDSNS